MMNEGRSANLAAAKAFVNHKVKEETFVFVRVGTTANDSEAPDGLHTVYVRVDDLLTGTLLHTEKVLLNASKNRASKAAQDALGRLQRSYFETAYVEVKDVVECY